MKTDEQKKTKYVEGVDFDFLDAMGIDYVFHQPWQIGLFHEELNGKYIWYPTKGTLMFEFEKRPIKVGSSGDYRGTDNRTEDVYEVILSKLRNQ